MRVALEEVQKLVVLSEKTIELLVLIRQCFPSRHRARALVLKFQVPDTPTLLNLRGRGRESEQRMDLPLVAAE